VLRENVRRHAQLVKLCGARLIGELIGAELVVHEELDRPEVRRLRCEETELGGVVRRGRRVPVVLVRDETEVVMQKFVAKRAVTTTETLSCFDGFLFTSICPPLPPVCLRGYQPAASP
jgi:hypothetical protein